MTGLNYTEHTIRCDQAQVYSVEKRSPLLYTSSSMQYTTSVHLVCNPHQHITVYIAQLSSIAQQPLLHIVVFGAEHIVVFGVEHIVVFGVTEWGAV